MTANIITAIGFFGIFLASCIALYFWKRASGLYSLLVEGANRYEELRRRGEHMEKVGQQLEERLKTERIAKSRLENALDEARAKTSDLTQRIDVKSHELTVVGSKYELQLNNLKHQTGQLKAEIDAVHAQNETKDAQLATLQKNHENDLAKLKSDLAALEKERAEMETKVKTGDPEEVTKARRKAAQMERLYQSMRGLKEMSDERNANWESALRKLSVWILEQKNIKPGKNSAIIGPLVSQALQATGQQLIEDSELDSFDQEKPGAGGVRASTMDSPPGRENKKELPEPALVRPVESTPTQNKGSD
jgi:predicted  nucleic acid-binding Zn-ribbon protein